MQACLSDTNIVVVAKDTDEMILLVYAYTIAMPTSEWFLKVDLEKCVNIRKLYNYLGDKLSAYLPRIHAISGCDKTFLRCSKGKITKEAIKRK